MAHYPKQGAKPAYMILGILIFLLLMALFFWYMFHGGWRPQAQPPGNQGRQVYPMMTQTTATA